MEDIKHLSQKADDRIFFKLNLAVNFTKKLYPEESLFGVYTYGDNTNIVCVIIPTFEDVCLNEKLINECHLVNSSKQTKIKLIDIRYVYQATKEGHPEIIESLYTDHYIINPRYDHIYHKLFRANREKFSEGIRKGIPAEELKAAILTIMRTVFNDDSKVVNFIKQITDIEKTAIEQIVAAVGDEGIFSQAKVASAAGISRAAMTNLVMKMQVAKVADVKYLGNRGTYIKILDDTLLKIRGR